MAMFVGMKLLLTVLQLSFVNSADIQQITSKLYNVQNLVFPNRSQTMIIPMKCNSAIAASLLTEFLKTSMDPIVITRLVNFRESTFIGKYSIVFIDHLDLPDYRVFLSKNRQIVVTPADIFATILDECISKRIFNVIYVTYDDHNCSLYHYNQFQRKLNHYWQELQIDPFTATTNDLSGLSMASTFDRTSDQKFLDAVAGKMNGTHQKSIRSNFTIYYNILHQTALYLGPTYVIYMHRIGTYHFLVPRLNEPIPVLYILTDPFDLVSWIMIFTTIVVLAMFRTCITSERSVLQLLKYSMNLLGSITTGSVLHPFRRELERQLVGLFLLLYVILLNAHGSLVISYLMTPRYYPELDTILMINDSCCWNPSPQLAEFNFKYYDDCRPHGGSSRVLYKTPCSIFDTWTKELLDVRIGTDLFYFLQTKRWSKATANRWPLMATLVGDPIVMERVQVLSRVFFGEGALNRFFQEGERDWQDVPAERSFDLEDLSLLWTIYGAGIGLGTMTFCVEISFEIVHRWIQGRIAVPIFES